jgi:hypothetical protein
VLSAEELERLETLTLQRTLDRMADLVYCPRCSVATIEDDSHCWLVMETVCGWEYSNGGRARVYPHS